jgi:rhodanese-related sulfurtransferase
MKTGRNVYMLPLFLAALFFVSCSTMQPTRPITDVSIEQLKKMLDQKSDFLLVDTRTEYEFRQGHIPGALNIPPHRFDGLAALLPSDKDLQIIFYCRGHG